ncbi:hypothetical protein PENSUB_3130 [Penicillium subrubescens]|uniref:Uncharacterized protein n=1 Tax=Penicillium subrubescens TaxID=1316194 RepID=A0A1Q5UFW7_9EURO|nr:hypothetical protein PENSUB_3130 [Penicillium subrubescens]
MGVLRRLLSHNAFSPLKASHPYAPVLPLKYCQGSSLFPDHSLCPEEPNGSPAIIATNRRGNATFLLGLDKEEQVAQDALPSI